MQDSFEIPVIYKDKEWSFKAQIIRYGFVHHIIVDLNGAEITIERDEENNFRAMGDSDKMKDAKVDLGLVQAVVEVLESL